MKTEGSRNQDSGKLTAVGNNIEYREAVRNQLNDELKKVLVLEMQKATQELIEEHNKVTKQVVEEYRTTIQQIVQEEKEDIWKRMETLKESILQLGLQFLPDNGSNA